MFLSRLSVKRVYANLDDLYLWHEFFFSYCSWNNGNFEWEIYRVIYSWDILHFHLTNNGDFGGHEDGLLLVIQGQKG